MHAARGAGGDVSTAAGRGMRTLGAHARVHFPGGQCYAQHMAGSRRRGERNTPRKGGPGAAHHLCSKLETERARRSDEDGRFGRHW